MQQIPSQPRCLKNSLFKDSDKARFKTLFWNAGGLTSDKFCELKQIIFINEPDIIGIVEAGAASENLDFFKMTGYQTFVLPRARQVASGIIIFVKSSIITEFNISTKNSNLDKLEAVQVKVWKNGLNKNFIICYNPPRNKPDLTWLERAWSKNCILIGDLNSHSTRWGYATSDATGQIIEDFIDSQPAEFIENDSGSPTFLSYSGRTSHPDIVVVHSSIAPHIKHTLVPAPGGFGHSILAVDLLSNVYIKKDPRRPMWNLKKADWKLYEQLTDKHINESVLSSNVDSSTKKLTEIIWECAHKSIPRGQVKRYTPFWNKNLQILKEERDRAKSTLQLNNNPSNRMTLKRASAKVRKEVILSKRAAYRNFLKNLDFRKDGVRAHGFISKLNRQKDTKSQPMKIGNHSLTSEKDISKHFCKYYSKISNFKPSKTNRKPEIKVPSSCANKETHPLLWHDIEYPELIAALNKMKKRKSAGPDNILPEFIVHLGGDAKVVLLQLFNQIWKSHNFPSLWRNAEIIPILKKDKSADNPSNFRPIALTSVISKLFERILVARLESLLNKNGFLSPNQAGFKKHRCTIEQVARISQEIKDGFHRKQSTLAVLVDFKTAFDRVWRKKLLSKLINKGVEGSLFHCIASFLAQRFIKVRYGNSVSPYKQIRQGLPQGSVLSPLLFNIMIDDLISTLQSIPGVTCLLYADDLIVWATSSDIKALETCLNQAMSTLKTWADSNEMLVNPLKTEYQLFTLSTKSYDLQLLYNGEVLSRNDEATYLGVKLDTKLSWNKHIEKQSDQATKRMGLMKRLAGTKWGASQDVLALAYKSYVRPTMEYGSEITVTASETALKKLDNIQNKALRLITGGPRSTPIAAMELQCDIEPLQMRREYLALSMYERVKRLEIPYWKTYKPAISRLKTQKNFSTKAEQLLEKHGLEINSRENFTPIYNHVNVIQYNLQLLSSVSKEDTSAMELKASALETLCVRYPEDEWLHVYTDGSAEGARKNAGAGVFCKLFKLSAPVGQQATNYEGEITAIKLALEALQSYLPTKVAVLVDSQAAILSIAGHEQPESAQVLSTRILANNLADKGFTIVLQWVPGHCGIYGNEEADRLAKEGSRMEQESHPLSMNASKRILRAALEQAVDNEQSRTAKGKCWEVLKSENGRISNELPRDEFVANFRLLTGHDYLQKHLHRIGIVGSPACVLCTTGEDMISSHLDTCPSLKDTRDNLNSNNVATKARLYWVARQRMAEIANELQA